VQVSDGTLLLDFSQASEVIAGNPVDINTNIINHLLPDVPGGATTTTDVNISHLVLSGGTVQVKGRSGATNTQVFKNYNSNTFAANSSFALTPGASKVVATQNGATSLTVKPRQAVRSQPFGRWNRRFYASHDRLDRASTHNLEFRGR
jgi:hypothetical protein